MGLSVPGRESSMSKYSVSKKNLVLKTSILSFSDVNLSLRLPQPSLVDRELGDSQILQPQVARGGTCKQEL